MSRFYFHWRVGPQVAKDEEGQELPDLSIARSQALKAAREILADAIKHGVQDVPDSFVISDSDGRELGVVSFREALPSSLR